jgi:glycine/betaine/sarcosine/D-proline reductase family selenoprotein B
MPVVQITAVPSVAKMVGVNRVLRGQSITNVLGNRNLPLAKEKELRYRYIRRALEILQINIKEPQIFTLEGTE